MAIVGVSSRTLPSVAPGIKQAAADIVRDPDAYFERQRTLCEREAEEYVQRELASLMRRRRNSRPTIKQVLARLSPA
ncbi:MAG: hypothetical protein ACRDQZ_08940 [Mycobacteriales bacterium]